MDADDKVKKAYEEMLNRELSNEEFQEARLNLVGFFETLIQINRNLKLNQKTNETPDN